MLDLVNLSNVLQSLQVKLSVARQRNNPKVFMWSSLLESSTVSTEAEQEQQEEQDEIKGEILNNITALGSVEEMEIAKEEVKEEKELEEMVTENGETDNKPSDASNSGTENSVETEETKEKPVISSQIENDENGQKMDVTEETKNAAIPSASSENPNNFGSELAEYFSSEDFDFPPNLLPSVSEMQRLLPDVIKDISGSLAASPAFPPTMSPAILPPPNIIPEPKRLDRDECRLNLILHIESLQKHIQTRLETLDTELEILEKRKDREVSGVVLASTMQDLRSAKIVNNSLPERI